MSDTTTETTAPAGNDVSAEVRLRRKTRRGVVISNKMSKTIVIQIETLKQHPVYGRTVRRSTHFKVHDENNEAGPGDTVEIMECRPISKEKCWRLVRIVERAK